MSDSNSDSNAVFVGFDVAKDFIDVCLLQGERKRLWRVRQTAAELAKLARKLAKLEPQLLVAEATGGYERELADVNEVLGDVETDEHDIGIVACGQLKLV